MMGWLPILLFSRYVTHPSFAVHVSWVLYSPVLSSGMEAPDTTANGGRRLVPYPYYYFIAVIADLHVHAAPAARHGGSTTRPRRALGSAHRRPPHTQLRQVCRWSGVWAGPGGMACRPGYQMRIGLSACRYVGVCVYMHGRVGRFVVVCWAEGRGPCRVVVS